MTAYSFKKRFIEPIRIGLGMPLSVEAFVAGMDAFGNVSSPRPKLQTIRAIGKRRHAAPGDTLQLYTAMRTKQCRLIGEALCTETTPMIIWVDDKGIAVQRGKILLNKKETNLFAQQDGFTDIADMAAFWRAEHPGIEKFEGIMISWRPRNGE